MRGVTPRGIVSLQPQRQALAGDYTLRDGGLVTVRRVTTDDKPRLQAALQELSMASRYLRFMGVKRSLSPAELAYFTEVDQDNHLAWLATDPVAAGGRAIGVARCVRLPAQPEVAEAAVTVVDAEQGRGIGTLLLQILVADARDHGIATFRAHVVADNARMLRLLEERGGTRRSSEGNEVTFDVRLTGGVDPSRRRCRSA